MRTSKPIGSRNRLRTTAVVYGMSALFAAARASGQVGAGPPAEKPADHPQPPPVFLFCSPIPPPMGAAPDAKEQTFSTGPAAPAAMAAYVNEPFYALLATRLVRNDLGGELALRLDRYRAQKAALLEELQARLYILRDSDPAVRERELEAFAREQTPRIAALESETEAIRRTLLNNEESSTDYFRWRLAHAGATDRSDEALKRATLSLLKADMYYREGLSPAQRGLLREMIAERTDYIEQKQMPKGQLLFRFSPDTSAILFAKDPPQDLKASLIAYEKQKASLEEALFRVLYPKEIDPNDVLGTESLRVLAIAQAPGLAALEAQAEDIRRKLAALGDLDRQPETAAVPADLQARITAHRIKNLALQKALLDRVEAVKKTGASTDSAALAESIRQAIAAFTNENADRYAALGKERDSIRADLSGLEARGSAPVSPDALAAQFSDSLKKLETYWDYRDYRNAVLQPGLSSEQRRLLFDGALQKLALPLPRGELLFEPGPTPASIK